MRLQKVASNKHLVFRVEYTLTHVITFRTSGRAKLVTETPKKGPKMVRGASESWASASFQGGM